MIRLLLALLFASAGLAAEPLRPSDFAYALDVQAPGDGSVYWLDLPAAVYAGVTRDDLADLRVFNAAENPVPHSLILSPDERAVAVTRQALPVFPIHGEEAEERIRIRLSIERSAEDASLHLERSGSVTGGRVQAYILDARRLSTPVHRFELDWEDSDFLTRCDLEASDDLESWRRIAASATLADLHHLGHHLRRDRIEVKPVSARYYRLRFPGQARAVRLSAVHAVGSHDTRVTRHQVAPATLNPGSQPGEYRFELPPGMRGERLRIHLPEVNTLAGAVLESRADSTRPWTQRRQLTLYRLRQDGVELMQDDVNPGMARDRQWRLLVDQSSGGLGPEPPRLEWFWRTHELRFVARGEGPYTLAWGSARILPESDPAAHAAHAMLRVTGIIPRAAVPGERVRELSGEAALRPRIDWRRWLLWAVLVLGALLLVWMALRQFRQMNP